MTKWEAPPDHDWPRAVGQPLWRIARRCSADFRSIVPHRPLQACSVDQVVLDQGIDTSAAVGRLFLQIIGVIGEFEHALVRERTMDDNGLGHLVDVPPPSLEERRSPELANDGVVGQSSWLIQQMTDDLFGEFLRTHRVFGSARFTRSCELQYFRVLTRPTSFNASRARRALRALLVVRSARSRSACSVQRAG